MSIRNLLYWIFGAVSIMIGMLVTSGLSSLGMTGFLNINVFLGMAIALLLILFGGLLWIGVAVSASEKQ